MSDTKEIKVDDIEGEADDGSRSALWKYAVKVFIAGFLATSLLISCSEEPVKEEKKEVILPPKGPVDDVMAKIAPEDRLDLQKAIACEAKKNNGEAIKIDGKYIIDIYDRMKTDPSISKC